MDNHTDKKPSIAEAIDRCVMGALALVFFADIICLVWPIQRLLFSGKTCGTMLLVMAGLTVGLIALKIVTHIIWVNVEDIRAPIYSLTDVQKQDEAAVAAPDRDLFGNEIRDDDMPEICHYL